MNNSTRNSNSVSSRRDFLQKAGLFSLATTLVQAGWVGGLLAPEARAAIGPNSVSDTFNGLAAFLVPGPDPYSIHQGVADAIPGGVSACTGTFLSGALDLIDIAPPPFPGFGAFVAFLLNHVAKTAYPLGTGPFASNFANLSFAGKGAVFRIMESGQAGAELVPLAGILPGLTVFIAYSEAGLLNAESCTVNGVPVGWLISRYEGVADGRNDFRGYFQGRQATV